MIGIPSFLALVCFVPPLCPARSRVVCCVIVLVTCPPAFLMSSVTSARVRLGRVPVMAMRVFWRVFVVCFVCGVFVPTFAVWSWWRSCWFSGLVSQFVRDWAVVGPIPLMFWRFCGVSWVRLGRVPCFWVMSSAAAFPMCRIPSAVSSVAGSQFLALLIAVMSLLADVVRQPFSWVRSLGWRLNMSAGPVMRLCFMSCLMVLWPSPSMLSPCLLPK